MDMFTEKNTGSNLPAQIELYATPGSAYSFLFMAKVRPCLMLCFAHHSVLKDSTWVCPPPLN